MTDDPDNVIPIKTKRPLTDKQLAANRANLERAKELTGVRPAGGHQARSVKGDKSGAGWGGPAKGMGVKGRPKGMTKEVVADRRAEKDDLRERMMGVLTEVAETSAFDSARIQAASAVLDRIDGKPIAQVATIDATADLRAWMLQEEAKEG